jgi:hypothetical protein
MAAGTGWQVVKDGFDWSGSEPTKSDFAMLRASVEAAQAATPTAVAHICAKPHVELIEALARMFGDAAAVEPGLHGSFHPDAPRRDGGTR